MNPKETISQLLVSGQLEEVFRQLAHYLPSGSHLLGELAILQSQYGNLQSQKSLRLISFQEEELARNGIIFGVKSIIDRWNPGGDRSALRQAIQLLKIDPDAEIGAMHLVNCDREAGVKKFRKVFNRKRDAKQAFQFYFIAA